MNMSDKRYRLMKNVKCKMKNLALVVEGVPHHLIDVAEPDEAFSVAGWKRLALKAARDIIRRGRLPIVVGGTGLYIRVIVDNLEPPAIAPSPRLRAGLESKTLSELRRLLKHNDPEAVKHIDLNNQRRIIRALEVAMMTGRPFLPQRKKGKPLFDVLQIGIDLPRAVLYRNIDERAELQIKEGLVDEVRGLFKHYDPLCPSLSAIGYRQIIEHLNGKMTLEEAVERIKFDTHAYARRQMTWFRRDGRIRWIRNPDDAETLAREFLS